MGEYRDPPGLVNRIQAIEKRLAALATGQNPPQYTTATRPPASSMPAAIIFNVTTGKHEGSDGTNWQPLY